MPRRRGLRQIAGILPHGELIIVVLLGMMRNVMNWLSFTWNGNVQEIWNLPGPEPSFTAKYHFDYWLKNVLSLVVLFRNYTTHLHLLFYVAMLYPVLTGERPRLMLPWLYLQMAKNIVTDVICTVIGVLLCWTFHSCGLMALEFFVVGIISTMPSIYLWHRLRSYYYDLYYAELDGEDSFPVMKASQGPTLAQRRRATKSLDGTMPIITSSDNRSRFNSCVTYDEFFGPPNREEASDNKVSKSLTTLLTIESQESDDAEEDPSLKIIDDENLTPAEKTLKFLGLTREGVDATDSQMQKTTSTTDLGKSGTSSFEPGTDENIKSSSFSVKGETVEPRAVGIQVRLPELAKSNGSDKVSHSSGGKATERSKKCECCEGTKCSKEDDTDSDEEETRSMSHSAETIRGKPLDCCDQNREKKGKHHEETDDYNAGNNPKTVSTKSTYHKNDLYPGSGLQVVVKRDAIAWENLKEINFVSVINKALSNEVKPFALQRDGQSQEKSIRQTFEHLIEDSAGKLNFQSVQNIKEIIPEREDGTKFIRRLQKSPNLNLAEFSGPISASFGVESDILATNTSYIFEKVTNSDTQSFDSTAAPTKQLIRPDHDSEFDSYFKSSFQRHSNMFHDTRAQLEPLAPLRGRVDSSTYRAVHRVDEDFQTDGNSVEEKTDGSSYDLGLYRSTCDTPQYPPDNYDGWDFDRGNLTGNEIDVVRDKPEITKSKDSETKRIATDFEVQSPSLQMAEKILASGANSPAKEINGLTQASQPSYMMMIIDKRDNSTTPVIAKNGYHPECNSKKGSKDRELLANSSRMSRSSRNGETPAERETKEMQALRAYNEKTLLKYKREMDARNRDERVEDKFLDPLARQSPGNSSNKDFYVPSVPELEKPEQELIFNIEKAYARFARSKPVDPVNSEALHGNCVTREFLEIYSSGNERLKKDSRKIKTSDKGAMRKQHSKYSKLCSSGGRNEYDVTSRSCKVIEGLQKGRELERTLAKENIRVKNVEVYFFDRQIDDKPSTSKKAPIIKTIKSFSRKNGADILSAVSSEILTPQSARSPMVEVLNNPEEISSRIEDSEFYRQLRKNSSPKSVKEAVENIDWSFQRPNFDGSNRYKENEAHDTPTGIARGDMSSERQDMVQKTTENILRSIFADSENSERGFRLGESANEFYPIFNTVAVAMEEIVRAAALRGYTDEFISQPATEIEIPAIGDGNLYGLPNLVSELRRRSSSGFVRCCILSEENRSLKKRSKNGESPSITTSLAPGLQDKKREALRRETDLLDQDESATVENEESSFLFSELISSTETRSAEVNIPVIGARDLPEEPEDTSGNRLEDDPSFPFKGLATQKKSPVSTRCHSAENSLQIGQEAERISPERVRSPLHNVIFQSPGQKVPDKDRAELEFDLASHRGILDHCNTGGQELQSIVFEFFDQFRNSVQNGDSDLEVVPRGLRGSEFIPQMQMLANLYAIEAKVGETMNASEETASGSAGNSSFVRDDQPGEETTQTGTSGTTNFEIVITNTSTGSRDFWRKDDRDDKENDEKMRRVVVKKNSNPISRSSSSEIFDKPYDDDKRLLSNISEPDSVPINYSELLNRANFRREVISSGFVQAIKQSASLSNAAKGTEVEILVPNNEDRKVEERTFTPNHEELIEIKSRNLVDAEPEVEMLDLWMTDDEEQSTSRTALVCPMNKVFSINPDNTTLDVVLRDIETAESAIRRMKTMFEQFFAEGQSRKEQSKEREASPEMKSRISSLTNLRFPVDWELKKLRNLVRTVANYVTITKSSPTQSIKSSNEPVESHVRKKEPNAGCRNESSDHLEDTPEILQKNGRNCYIDDHQATRVPVPKTGSFLKNYQGPVRLSDQIDGFSSWDRVIPLSTKRQIAKSNRKTKSKKAVVAREPARRVVKVANLTEEEKNVDFFGARSVPQRGRGLSSGYLMDSDSDGNFTVSRPPTPASVESETSLILSGDNDLQPGVSSRPLGTSEIFPMCETSQSRITNRMKGEFPSKENPNSMDNSIRKTGDGAESMPIQESLEISRSSLVIDAEAPSTGESAQMGSIGGDLNIQNAFCNEEMHLLGEESSSIASDLRYMRSVDAAGIENKLKDVVQQMLNHQLREVNSSINGFRTGSKNASFTSIPDCARTESSTDFQSNNYNPKDDVEDQKPTTQDYHRMIQELLSKTEDTAFEQLDVHCQGLDATSRNSDAVSFEVTPRKSRISVRNVSIGTEHSVEVFKDLLDLFERVRSIEEKTMPGQASKSCKIENGNDAHDDRPINYGDEREIVESNSHFRNQVLPMAERNTSGTTSSETLKDMPVDSSEEQPSNRVSNSFDNVEEPDIVTTSYDSFSSTFSQQTTDASEPSGQAISISNHTYFEDFPEQFDSVAADQSSSKSDDGSKKDVNWKKRGIPRPVKGSKERK